MESNLLKELEADRKYFANLHCPKCGSDVQEVEHPQAFTPGRLSPAKLAQCVNCKTTFEPFTGIIVKDGNIFNNLESTVLYNLDD